MIKQNIILGGYPYYTELFDAQTDLMSNPHYDNFVMLRSFEIVNNIPKDTDIYFIEKNIFDVVCETNVNNSTKLISFPTPNKINIFSNTISDFDNNITFNTVKKYKQYYNLYNKSGEIANILCNKLKVYHPLTKNNINAIIHIDNYINNIHFHYICAPIKTFHINSETELNINNQTYSEYFELWFPNVKFLFKENFDTKDFNVYFYEDLYDTEGLVPLANIIQNYEYVEEDIYKYFKSVKGEQKIESKIIDVSDKVKGHENSYEYVETQRFITNENQYSYLISNIDDIDKPINLDSDNVRYVGKTFKFVDTYNWIEDTNPTNNDDYELITTLNDIVPTSENKKVKIKSGSHIIGKKNNCYNPSELFVNYPINITLFPYTNIDEINNIYVKDEQLPADTEIYVGKQNISLSCNVGFNNGNIALIGKFKFPTDYVKFNNKTYNTVEQLYCYYNNISPKIYVKYQKDIDDVLYKDIDNITENDLTQQDIDEVQDFILHYKLENNDRSNLCIIWNDIKNDKSEILKVYKDMKKNVRLKEYEDEHEYTPAFFGYRIKIATDKNFANIIYQNTQKVFPSEDKLNLDNVAFNINGLFKDWNDIPDHLVAHIEFIDTLLGMFITSNASIITKEWLKYTINDLQKNSLDKLFKTNINMETTLNNNSFNFLNNITCVINKEPKENSTTNRENSMRVLYKPYFFKASDLQNVRIRQNVQQNIGINLVDYMTKVENFILNIDGNSYKEIGRNDIYVIFNVTAQQITQTSGNYDITDSDGNYISSGKYTIY